MYYALHMVEATNKIATGAFWISHTDDLWSFLLSCNIKLPYRERTQKGHFLCWPLSCFWHPPIPLQLVTSSVQPPFLWVFFKALFRCVFLITQGLAHLEAYERESASVFKKLHSSWVMELSCPQAQRPLHGSYGAAQSSHCLWAPCLTAFFPLCLSPC